MNELDRMLMQDYSLLAYANNTSNTSVTDMLTSLNAEKLQLEGILSTITGEMNTYLSSKGDFYYTLQPNYGVSNVIDWIVYVFDTELDNNGPEDDVTYVDEYTFKCLNDHTSVFTPGSGQPMPDSGSVISYPVAPSGCLLIDCGVDGIIDVYVTASAYPSGGTNTTTVTVSGDTITSNINKVSTYDSQYSYSPSVNWDSDAYILQRINEFDYTYDHLHHTLDATGTYGVIAKIAALTTGSATITANKAKTDVVHSTYLRFTDWVLTFSGSNLSYYDDVTFLCSGGDYTNDFPVSGSLLINCGTDGYMGGITDSSEYITSHTEVKLIPDFNKIESSNENYFLDNTIESVSISGTVILDNNGSEDDVTFIDENTFSCPGYYTEYFYEGVIDVTCVFSDRTVYYTVYSAEIVDLNENYTKVKYGSGLPITNNITAVYTQ